MATPVGAADFPGSIVVSCALSYACGLGSGGNPQIQDRAMEALLRLFPLGASSRSRLRSGARRSGLLPGSSARSMCAVWQRWCVELRLGRGWASVVGFPGVSDGSSARCVIVELELRW